MAIFYGVLHGKIDIFKREDNLDTPHLQVKLIDGQNQAWRVPVNVLSSDKSFLIFHRLDPLQSHPLLQGLPQLPAGFTPLPPAARSASSAVDYFRAPLFDWPTGVAVPSTRPGANDDLQDALIASLQQLKAQNGELFVFGAKFPEPGKPFSPKPIDTEFKTSQGIHDIHMNQGNPSNSHAEDNGIFQDGGLILKFPSRFVGLFLRFQTQWLPTDNTTGHRSPNAQPIPAGGTPGDGGQPEPPPQVSNPAVYIERALVNPIGDDPRKEAVVLGNSTSAPADITGWSLVDKNDNVEIIGKLSLPPGESRLVILSGKTAQLGNKGGSIRLKNKTGVQVHAVSYAQEDAREEGRYVRFNT